MVFNRQNNVEEPCSRQAAHDDDLTRRSTLLNKTGSNVVFGGFLTFVCRNTYSTASTLNEGARFTRRLP